MPRVFVDIGQLISLTPLALDRRCTAITAKDLGILEDAWLALDDAGMVLGSGAGSLPREYFDQPKTSLSGRLVIPGLIDAHTHPIFGGSRAREFAMRLNGHSYEEIAAAGGGIQSTVRGTRGDSDDALGESLAHRLKGFLKRGVTTLEVKSGYGLSVSEELRLLKLLNRQRSATPQRLKVTCLALHSNSPEHATLQDYVAATLSELLPEIASKNLADYCDAFIERGYFSVGDVEPYAVKAKELGLGLRIHADEFSDAGAAEAAARWGADSADHLQYASENGIRAMARSGTTAVILPGTSLYTNIRYSDAARFTKAGVPVAIASDFNPGSSLIDNLPMLATIAGLYCGLNAAEVVAGITYVPAASLGLGDRKGALAPGFDGDFLVFPLSSVDEWLWDFGRTLPDQVWISGRDVTP